MTAVRTMNRGSCPPSHGDPELPRRPERGRAAGSAAPAAGASSPGRCRGRPPEPPAHVRGSEGRSLRKRTNGAAGSNANAAPCAARALPGRRREALLRLCPPACREAREPTHGHVEAQGMGVASAK